MRPYTILNAAMTLDGKIATANGSSNISGPEDLQRVHKIRQETDAIMIGINTLLNDNPRLTIHKIKTTHNQNPHRIIIDSKARTPLNARILNNDAPTTIAITQQAPTNKINALKEKCNIVTYGKTQVDLKQLMHHLKKDLNINKLMLEGGSTLNFSMIKNQLIDEIRICIAPMIVGGKQSKTLIDGTGFPNMDDSTKLKLQKAYPLGKDYILEYKVKQ